MPARLILNFYVMVELLHPKGSPFCLFFSLLGKTGTDARAVRSSAKRPSSPYPRPPAPAKKGRELTFLITRVETSN